MPNENDIEFRIPGRQTPTGAAEILPDIGTIAVRESYQIRPPTRGGEDLVLRKYTANTLIELEFASGARRYTRADQLAADLITLSSSTRGGPTQTAGEPIIIPAALGSATRGDSELLAAFRVLDVSPLDPVINQLAKSGAEFGARKIAAFFEERLKTGLYQLDDPRDLTRPINEPISTTPGKPILLLLHGTASSTVGSFSGLAGKNEWKQFLSDYDRILALEHCTFSVSPVQNAIDAASLLPRNARLHLLSHSRGGLVGELLCLNDIRSNQLEEFKRRQPGQIGDIETLAALLREKSFIIERFVRVACPSRGTLLASDRLDLYFSLLLKVLEYVPPLHDNPIYAVFKAMFLKLIEMKASPDQVPGIEAMRPESPFIALLNRPDLSTQADLAIVAGRTDGFAFSLRSLVKLASDAFYREANDFVVNTESMYWGMHRKNGSFYFSDRGTDVSHFQYFKNDRTRKQIAAWLSRAEKRPSNLFVDLNLRTRRDLMFPEWRGEDKRPMLVYIPPFLGTYMRQQRGRLWLEVPGLLPGDLDVLPDLNKLSIDGVVPYRACRLLEYLSGSFAISLFEYDWRKPIANTVNALALFIRDRHKQLQDTGRPLAILAFSSGGVLLGKVSEADPNLWKDLSDSSTHIVALGNPAQAVRNASGLINGTGELLHLLRMIDGREPDALAAIFANLEGISQLVAEKGKAVDKIAYVLGRAPVGEAELSDATTWFANTRHGNLADHPASFHAIRDLLISGSTNLLSDEPYAAPAPSRPVPRLYPTEAELFDAAFNADHDSVVEPPLTIDVYVKHSHLREAMFPVTVGHYLDDVIVSAEKVLDEQLSGRLSNRFHMDLYPGRDGSLAVIEAPDCRPPGALVIGLGEVGKVTAEKVRNGVAAVALGHALKKFEASGRAIDNGISVGLSSVLLGTYGGNALSVRESVGAIIEGVVQANRTLRSRNLNDRIRVDQIEIVELYEDLAIQAAHELVRLEERLREYADERVILNVERYVRSGDTGQFHRPLNPYVAGWWRRISITQTGGLFRFTSLTERARAEERQEARQLGLVDDLVHDAIATTTYDEDLSTMLFEVLLSNDLKDQMRDEASLVFVVDETSAGYPWELLAQRTRKTVKPLATNLGLLRQFATPKFRLNPRSSRQNSAFVVGDPENPISSLPKAQQEAEQVSRLLESTGYEVKLLRRQEASARSVLTQLFAREYRILHLAGHGKYNSDDLLTSGLVLSGGKFLTSAEIDQLRILPELVFLNCCFLGESKTESDRNRLVESRPNKLAASIAHKLIDMGVKAVVAAGWAVEDDAALTFASTFYREMIDHGENFGQSVLKARQETFRQHPGSNTWGAYQCYGNPDFSLTAPQDGVAKAGQRNLDYVARQEYLDRLRSIRSQARGANDTVSVQLSNELVRIESSIPHEWLDGEVLTYIGASYGELGLFEQALETYRRALADPKARQPFAAVEQLINLLDRSAGRQRDGAGHAQWQEALDLLDRISGLGVSPERLSLAGGLYKRMADANPKRASEALNKALNSYDEASARYRDIHGRPYLYGILNSIGLKLILNSGSAGGLELKRAHEALRDATSLAQNAREIWDRAGEPDALLLVHLLEGDLIQQIEYITAKYKAVLDDASPRERDSIGNQIRFLNRHLPNTPGLPDIVGRLGL